MEVEDSEILLVLKQKINCPNFNDVIYTHGSKNKDLGIILLIYFIWESIGLL